MLNPFSPPSPPRGRCRRAHLPRGSIVASLAALLLLGPALTGCGGSSGSSPPPGGGGADDDTIAHVTAGGYTALALDGDGDVLGWGSNRQGELGDGTLTDRSTPVPVTMPPGVSFDQLSAGFFYSLALDEGGQAWAWGNPQGTGPSDTTLHREPVRVTMPNATIFTLVSAGDGHSLALDQNGRAWGWGLNSYGQVGDGSTTDRTQPVPVDMPVGVRFTTVAAGDLQSAALDQDGAIWVWGSDSEDMFGGGADDRMKTPVQVTPPVLGLTFQAIDVGSGGVAIDENFAALAEHLKLAGRIASRFDRNLRGEPVHEPDLCIQQRGQVARTVRDSLDLRVQVGNTGETLVDLRHCLANCSVGSFAGRLNAVGDFHEGPGQAIGGVHSGR